MPDHDDCLADRKETFKRLSALEAGCAGHDQLWISQNKTNDQNREELSELRCWISKDRVLNAVTRTKLGSLMFGIGLLSNLVGGLLLWFFTHR